MKAYFVLLSFMPFMPFMAFASASNVSIENAVKKSNTINSLLRGIEADFKVKCEALLVAKHVSIESFTAKTACNGKDSFGDDYAVIVEIAGSASENFATVATINMQVIP